MYMKNQQPGKWLTLSLQHMFAMFGATILVPQLVGLSPAIALLTSGIATIVFILVTRFQVPAYLGSSFAFIIPIQVATAEWRHRQCNDWKHVCRARLCDCLATDLENRL